MKKIVVLLVIFTFFAVYLEESAFARAGGGGSRGGSSFGSRGSRTYSAPARPSQPAQRQDQFQRQQTQQPVAPAPVQQPSRFGGFMRGMAGGILGGMIGGLIFRGLGFGGMGGGMSGGMGGGIGLIEIMLIGLAIFIIYKIVKSKKQQAFEGPQQYQGGDYNQPYQASYAEPQPMDALAGGLANIRQFDPSFDEKRFKDTATDIFFKVQAAWMNRDMEAVRGLLAPEILEAMRNDVSKMKAERRINRLENIAMRNVDITEAWQEQGKDYITVEITANVLDYMTDESGLVIEGSNKEPVKFMEYWTYVKPVGTIAWQLSAIQQGE